MADMSESQLPARLQQIVEDFQLCEGREKLELLLEYSNKMPSLPERFQGHNEMDLVPECMTPVFVHGELEEGGMKYYFDVPPESPSVRGYAALLAEGVQGCTPEQILAIPGDFYYAMGLQDVLSGQRLNGMRSIVAFIKRLAQRELTARQS
jgi:cysteine desulfuration protein SufE